MNNSKRLIQRARLALQAAGFYIDLLMLPGGYALALVTWVARHWPLTTART